MWRPSSTRTYSITTTSCSIGRTWWPSRRLPPEYRRRFDHVLVDEYQDTNRLQASILLALKPNGRGLDGRRRRCAIDLFVSRRDRAQHPRLSRPVQPARRGHHARAELPLDAADPRRRQRGDRTRRRALHQEPVVGSRLGRAAAAGHRARRDRAGALCGRAHPAEPRSRHRRSSRRPCCSAPRTTRPARSRADAAQHPVRQIRRPEVPRSGAHQGRARGPALCRESARPRRRLPRHSAAARYRTDDRGPRSSIASRRDADRGPCRLQAASRGRGGLAGLRRVRCGWCAAARPAGRPSSSSCAAGTSRIWSACTTTPSVRQADLVQLAQIAAELSEPRAFSHRAHARSARRDQRRSGRAAARRGLSDPLDHSFGQGPGMERGVRAQRRRRLHPGRSRDRHQAPRSRKSGACSTSP